MDKVQRVLQVLQSKRERRVSGDQRHLRIFLNRSYVPLLDQVVQPRDRLSILQVLCQAPLSSSKRSRKLLRKSLVLPELDQQRLVQEVLDVLVVVERSRGRRSLVGLLLVERLTRVDT